MLRDPSGAVSNRSRIGSMWHMSSAREPLLASSLIRPSERKARMSENEETKEELRGMSEEARLLLHLIDCSKRLVFCCRGKGGGEMALGRIPKKPNRKSNKHCKPWLTIGACKIWTCELQYIWTVVHMLNRLPTKAEAQRQKHMRGENCNGEKRKQIVSAGIAT